MKQLYLLFVFIALCFNVYAQNTFEKIIDSSLSYGETTKASCVSSAGDFVVLTNAESQIGVVKITTEGDTLWYRNFNTTNGTIYGQSICVGSDGGYLVAGNRHDNTGQDIYLLKIDEEGNKVWEQQIGLPDKSDSCNDVKAIAGEGYVLTGRVNETGPEIPYLMKVNESGTELWRKTDFQIDGVSYSSNIHPYSVEVLTDGFLVAGYCNEGTVQGFVLKIDKNRNKVWSSNIGGSNHEYLQNSALCSNGDVLFVGRREYITYSNSYCKIWYGKLDANGTLLWEKELKESNYNYGLDIVEDKGGNLILAGRVHTQNYSQDPYLVKVDASGNLIWEKIYGGYSDGGLQNCFLVGDNIIGIGYEYADWNWGNNHSNAQKPYIVKTDLEGNVNDLEIYTKSENNCEGQDNELRTLGFLTNYSWITPNTHNDNSGYSYWASTAGDYSVTAVDRNGNTRTSNTVTIHPQPVPNISFVGETTICSGQEITLSTSQEFPTYEWFRTDTLENKNLQLTSVGTSREYVANQSANYQVQVTNEFGCKNSVSPWEGKGQRITVIDPKVQIQSSNKRQINLVLGDGMELNGERLITQPAPWGSYKKSSHQQYLIRADELLAMGVEANSELKELAFFMEKANNMGAAVNGFRIKMALTSLNELNALNNSESYREVNNEYSVHEYLDAEGQVTSGWKNFPLTYHDYSKNEYRGFLWDGVSNVIIDVAYYNEQQTTYSNLNSIFRLTEMGYNASYVRYSTDDLRYVYSGGSPSTLRPNMRFRVELPSGDDIIVGCGTEINLKLDKTYFEVEWSTGSTADQITVSEPGTISVTTTDDYGCVATDTKEIKLSQFDVNIVADKTTFCEGDQANLSIQGDYPFVQWNTGETTKDIVASLTGIYSVEVRNEDACVAEDMVELSEIKKPIILENTGNTEVRPGQEINGFIHLGQFDGNHYYVFDNTGVDYNYAKQIVGGTSGTMLTVTSQEENDFIVNSYQKADATGIWINYSDEQVEGTWKWRNGEESSFTYWDDNQPVSDMSEYDQYDYAMMDYYTGKWRSTYVNSSNRLIIEFDYSTPKAVICDSTNLVASGDFKSYTWYKDGVEISKEASIVVKQAGTYTVTGLTEVGCSLTSDPIEITTVSTTPVIDGLISGNLCSGDGSVTLDAGTGFAGYNWSTGETTQSISVSEQDYYSVTVTNNDGCPASKEFSLRCKTYVSPGGNDTNEGTQASPFLTIQHALNSVIPGDTIIVMEGTYLENIDFNKEVVLGSEFLVDGNKEHIANTIIDGQQMGTVVRINQMPGDAIADFESLRPSALIGFTIQNGKSTSYDENQTGGGINLYSWVGIPFQLKNLIIKNNEARRGGGISTYYSSCVMKDLTIESNKANEEGSGIYLYSSYEMEVDDILIKNNQGNFAFRIWGQNDLVISNLQLIGNNGHGLYFYSNDSYNAKVTLKNPLIVKNQGNGIQIERGTLDIINATIANNLYGINQGYQESYIHILNSIICNNKYQQIIPSYSQDYDHSVHVNYSAIEKGMGGISADPVGNYDDSVLIWGEGNLETAIQFVDTTTNDYSLLPTSPAIGAGIGELVVDGVTYSTPLTDLYGTARPNPADSKPDLGAIENDRGVGELLISVNECGGNIYLEIFNKEAASISWIGPDGFTSSDQNLIAVKEGEYQVTVVDVEGTSKIASVIVKDPLRYTLDIKHVCAAAGGASGRLYVAIKGGKGKPEGSDHIYNLFIEGPEFLRNEYYGSWNADGENPHFETSFEGLKAGIYRIKISDATCTLEEEFEILSKESRRFYVSTEGDDDNIGSEELPLSLIQTAIDRACDLDTIIVEPGIYTERIAFNGRNVAVASRYILDKDESFIAQTILDGNEEGTVVSFQNGESRDAKLIGFTIQNGRTEMSNYENGGGITIRSSNPTVDHLIVKNNRARIGGGLYMADCQASVTNVHFDNNIATEVGDAMNIQNIYSGSEIDNLFFTGGSNSYCTVKMNQYFNVEIGRLSFENFGQTALIVEGNWDGEVQVTFDKLQFRSGQQGVRIHQGNYIFKNMVASDIASEVISLDNNAKVALINSTLVDNSQAVRMNWGDSKLLVMNSILRNNFQEISYNTGMDGYGKSIEVHYSNIKGGKSGIIGDESSLHGFVYGETNFDREEYFVDAENRNYKLLDISPSVGAGISTLNVFDTDYTMPSFDFDGKKRSIPTGSSVDLGAFENESISRKIVHAISCNGGNDGSISIEMLTGKAPFTYLWDDENNTTEAKVIVTEADKMFHVTVTDADGKTFVDSAWVTQPDELVAFVADSTNITREGLANGDATIGVRGGNPPYNYYWEETGATTNYANNLEANKYYQVTVIDDKGCTAQVSVMLKVLPLVENDLCGFASQNGEIKLSSTNITAIETDFEGTIWFATQNELTSYDGQNWDTINANFSYRSIHKDKAGNIWLGADWGEKGLNMNNGRSWFSYRETDGLAGNNVFGITEDSYDNLWIATDKGVSRYDGDKFTNFTNQDGLIDNYTTCIFADQDGYIWVGSNSGISRYKTLSKDQGEEWENFQYQDGVSLGGIRHIVQDKEGNIWLGSTWDNGAESGLIKYDGASWTRVEPGLDITINGITDIYCDTEGGIWVGTSNGLAHYDGSAWHAYKNGEELPSNYISAIGEDAYGAIWVGYSDGDNGISKYFNNSWTTLYKANGSDDNSIQAMALDAENNLWVGTSDWQNSLRRFDGNTWKTFNQEDGYYGNVYDLDTDSELKVWVATYDGLFKYNGNTFDKYDTSSGLKNGIHRIAIDANDNVWVCYNEGHGLDRFTGNEITPFTTSDGLLEDYIRDVQADSKGNIYIAYGNQQQSKLSKYDGTTFTTVSPNEENSMEQLSLEKIFVDSKDRVWVSSQYRLAVYDGTSWTTYDLEQHGLSIENYINGIGEDADGNIWIGFYNMYNASYSQVGAIKYDGTNWVTYSEEDGLLSSNINCIQDDNQGHVWFGSSNGLIRYTKCTNEDVIVNVNNGGCSGEEDRQLEIIPTGDNAPYQYSIDRGSTFQTENIFTGLTAGTYYLVVKNKNGEVVTDREVVITEPVPLRANVEGFNTTCNGRTDGAALCIPTGGTAPYTFEWDDANATSTARVEGLSEGTEYTVIVTDATGCTAEGTVSVGHDPHLKFTDWSNVSCHGLTDGMAVITPIGGKAPFTYQWDDVNQTKDSIVTSLSGGVYHHVIVTDANNCVAKDSIKLEQPGEFVVHPRKFNSCDGDASGGIELSIEGGTIPYTYQWDDETQSTEGNLYDLKAGSYNVTVTDANGCEAKAAADIEQHDSPLSVEIVNNKGEFFCPEATELVATEGFASYLWSTGEKESSIVPLMPGKHYVRVYDDKLCSAIDTIEIHSLRTYQNQQLCLVTVNKDNKNEIVWERRNGLGIVSYNIYKESNSASTYELVQNVDINNKSALVDEDSDPSARSHTYAISIVDVCGVESRMSDIHHTMLLQANKGINGEVNLDWNKYEGFEFETYNIYRGTSVEDMTLLTSISNTESKYIDNYPLDTDQYFYVLEVQNDYTCDPSQLKSSLTDYSVSRSNYLSAKSTATGINDTKPNVESITVYPNPMVDRAYARFDNANFDEYELFVMDVKGSVVYTQSKITTDMVEIPRGNLKPGHYIVELRGEKIFRGRLVVK
eukprot:TRINITY_DN5012_c0_g2_i2.p1 TRINITY_DN5012_c0_g2~~TRINITY_DN5012_c0_g2_i2.p1  ORF type:complete len:3629 (+),score=486.46 TRINITY_DN5012_c0_g2_i2:186-11072(+)